MFGWFKKKVDPKAEENEQLALDASYNMLMTQLELGNVTDNADAMKRVLTPFAMGYIFGFADATLQKAGIANDAHGMACLAITHMRLFGDDKGSRLFGHSLKIQADTKFIEGRNLGGKELYRWVSEKDFTPLGLTDHLHGQRQMSEE